MAGLHLPAGFQPHEGCGSFGCISLFAEAGCNESVTFRWAPRIRDLERIGRQRERGAA